MLYLLAIALVYLIITTLILLWNRYRFSPLPEPDQQSTGKQPNISVLIPARNEDKSIRSCVKSIMDQAYDNFELIVLDDQSTDRTGTILKQMQNDLPGTFNVIKGDPKPDDWLGKPWACHQLFQHSSGDILLFADADTSFESDTLTRVATAFEQDQLDALTVWPQQTQHTYWEKTVIPLVYHALLTLLPVRYVYKKPWWLPRTFEQSSALFAAACGQFLAFQSEAYQQIGGHAAVRDAVVEDLALARRIKRHKLTLRMYHGLQTVSCRMYRSNEEMLQGFRKNFLAGFDYNIPKFVFMAILQLLVFLVPLLLLPIGWFVSDPVILYGAAAAVLLMIIQRLILAAWFKWNVLTALIHPVGVLWFQRLGFICLVDYLKKRTVQWKGRSIT